MTENRERISGCGAQHGLRHCAARHVRRLTLIETSCVTDSSPLGVPRTATGKRTTKLSNLLYNCRELTTNRFIFLQNKAKFQKSQMNVKLIITKDYEENIT